MEGTVRYIFSGGNTPKGFYSYYNYILPQEKAARIYCIKGGPGVGKSTMMRSIGEYFVSKGEAVDMFLCSSDPDSLDGILINERNVLIVDGTAPHIIDPINPGAVDEIIDLAGFLDHKILKKQKDEIITTSFSVSDAFKAAYSSLSNVGLKYELLSVTSDHPVINNSDDLMKLLDNKRTRVERHGNEKRFFSYAITFKGLIDHTYTLIKGIKNIFTIDGQPGMKTENVLMPIANRLMDNGFDVELYYSPMCPDTRVEHIISKDADMAVITMGSSNNEYMRKQLQKVFEQLSKAKLLHDELEKYYIPAMDFDSVEETGKELIKTIENEYS